MNASSLSVVIPARDAADSLPAVLAALAAQDVGEAIVADDGSTDGTPAVAAAAGAKVVEVGGRGRSAARNRGADAAGGPGLAFLDADCRPEPGWAEAIARGLANTPLVGGAVRVVTSAAPAATERFDALWRFRQERTIHEGGWAASANLAVGREAFDALGGFDESFGGTGEDVDLCTRAARRGLAIAYCGDAVVTHPASASLREVLARGVRMGYGASQLHRIHNGAVGRRYWRHPGGIVRGGAALRALGVDTRALDAREARRMRGIARAEYAARFAGSAIAGLRGA